MSEDRQYSLDESNRCLYSKASPFMYFLYMMMICVTIHTHTYTYTSCTYIIICIYTCIKSTVYRDKIQKEEHEKERKKRKEAGRLEIGIVGLLFIRSFIRSVHSLHPICLQVVVGVVLVVVVVDLFLFLDFFSD